MGEIKSNSSAVTLEAPIPNVRTTNCEKEGYVCGEMNGRPMIYKPAPTECDARNAKEGAVHKETRDRMKFWPPHEPKPQNQESPQGGQ